MKHLVSGTWLGETNANRTTAQRRCNTKMRCSDSSCVLLFPLNRLRTEPGSADSNAFEVLF